MLNGHGDDLYNYFEIRYNFSSNVYYKSCHHLLVEHLANSIPKNIGNYPSPTAFELCEYAAKKHGLQSKQFLFFNGATEAFYLIAQKFKGKKVVIFGPTFSEYEDACKSFDLKIKWAPKDTFSTFTEAFDLAFLCNPNNPDGSVTSIDNIQQFLSKFPQCQLILDEAYIEFTTSVTSAVTLLNTFKNLIIVRSLTKVFAIPGLRLGYVIAHKTIIEALTAIKMPWSVNAMAIEAGTFIFKHYDDLHFSKKLLQEEMAVFIKQLSAISFLELHPTNTNYVLAKLTKGKASDFKKKLAIEHNILIRAATNFKGLEGEFIRLALQNEIANSKLINVLKQLKEW